jgi:chromate transporter
MRDQKDLTKRLLELAAVFLKLGFTAFGGPVAAIAMMRQACVLRRRWLSEEAFLDFWGITNLVPGPNATELAIHIGYAHAGWLGLITAGVCYILPAMGIVMGLAWAYVRWGALPTLEGLLYGVKPVVAAVLVDAWVGMLRLRWKRYVGLGLVVLAFAAYLLGLGPLWVMLIGGALLSGLRYAQSARKDGSQLPLLLPLIISIWQGLEAASFSLGRLFWFFLKAGALMYGSGYVLLAFIREDLVMRLGWLTDSQMVDAIAIGQVTPGPLSTTATFVGYLLGGVPAALLATLAMFLPGFLFVAFTHPLLERLRENMLGRTFLDGVQFAALGLMAGVTWRIGVSALVDPLSVGMAMAAFFLLLRYNLPAPWLILVGALVGVGRHLLGI